jgi:hypothetical protein
MGKLPDGVHVTGECGDEWADKVVSHGHFPIERPSGKPQDDFVREVGQNLILIRALPRIEVFGKHTDYAGGRSLVCAAPPRYVWLAWHTTTAPPLKVIVSSTRLCVASRTTRPRWC